MGKNFITLRVESLFLRIQFLKDTKKIADNIPESTGDKNQEITIFSIPIH